MPQNIWKSIKTEAVFTKTEINNKWNVHFSSKYELCYKSVETEALFTKTEKNNKENVHFLQNSHIGIQYAYSNEFFNWSKHLWNPLFSMVWNCIIVFHSLSSMSSFFP